MAEYEFEIKYVASEKNVIAHYLSRCIEEAENDTADDRSRTDRFLVGAGSHDRFQVTVLRQRNH